MSSGSDHRTESSRAHEEAVGLEDARSKAQPLPHGRGSDQTRSTTSAVAVPESGSRKSITDELEVLIRARYPIIHVVTWEERRVERQLRKFAADRSKQLYCWSVTTGLLKSAAGQPVTRTKGLADPVEALDAVIEHKEPAIYLFKDFHSFMRPRDCNAGVIRKLREVALALSDSYKTLVITSPLLDIAPELQKDVSVLDYPLPEMDDFGHLLDRICEDVSENTRINLDLTPDDREKLVRAALGLTLQEAENVFAKTIVNDGTLDASDVSVVFSEKQQIIRKSGLLEYYESHTAMGDVGGLDMLKEWLAKRSLAFSKRRPRVRPAQLRRACSWSACRAAARACVPRPSRECGTCPCCGSTSAVMFSSLVGSSEENVRRAISRRREHFAGRAVGR